MQDTSHSWQDFISEWAGSAPVFGYAPFEIVYKKREGNQIDPGRNSRFNDGMIGVRKLAIRHPDTLDRWVFSEKDGSVEAMIQRAAPDWQTRIIPIEKLLLFRIRSRKASPQGRSLLRNAYTSYYRKKRLENIEAIGIERDLTGVPAAWVPPSLLRTDASNEDKALLAEIKKIVKNLRNDEQAGLVFPLVYNDKGNKLYDFTLLSSANTRRTDTNAIIERYNRMMAMTILADVILIGHEKVGSFALASSKTNLFATGLGAMMDDIEEVLNRHLVPRLLRLNGIAVDAPPQFRHGDIESIDLAELGEFVKNLAGAGAPIFPSTDGELEKHMLRLGNLPTEGVISPEDLERQRQQMQDSLSGNGGLDLDDDEEQDEA